MILGTGKAKFEKQVQELDKKLKGRYKGVVKFSAPLAHLITAGADFILVPSRFEPCGLIQLHAMQYGTVPVVASTGGLVDTVKEGVTGFHIGALDTVSGKPRMGALGALRSFSTASTICCSFPLEGIVTRLPLPLLVPPTQDKLNPADVEALASTAARAAQAFTTPLFKDMVYNAISQDLSWAKPAKKVRTKRRRSARSTQCRSGLATTPTNATGVCCAAASQWEGVLEQLYLGLPSGQEKAASVDIPVKEQIPALVAATDKPLTRSAPSTTAAPTTTSAPARSPASFSAPPPAPFAPPAPSPAIPKPVVPTTFTPRSIPTAPTLTPIAPAAAPPKPAAVPVATESAPAVAAPKPAKQLVSAAVGASNSE